MPRNRPDPGFFRDRDCCARFCRARQGKPAKAFNARCGGDRSSGVYSAGRTFDVEIQRDDVVRGRDLAGGDGLRLPDLCRACSAFFCGGTTVIIPQFGSKRIRLFGMGDDLSPQTCLVESELPTPRLPV